MRFLIFFLSQESQISVGENLLPNGLNSGSLETAVAGDEWNTQIKGCSGNDAVGHVGNDIPGELSEVRLPRS